MTIQDEDYLVGTFFGEVKEKSFAAQTQEEKKSKREKHPAALLYVFSDLINRSNHRTFRDIDPLIQWPAISELPQASLLRCFDTVFQRPYRYFLIALKVVFPLSDRFKIFTSNWLWIETCENIVLKFIASFECKTLRIFFTHTEMC